VCALFAGMPVFAFSPLRVRGAVSRVYEGGEGKTGRRVGGVGWCLLRVTGGHGVFCFIHGTFLGEETRRRGGGGGGGDKRSPPDGGG